MDRRRGLARTVMLLAMAVIGGAIAAVLTGAASSGSEAHPHAATSLAPVPTRSPGASSSPTAHPRTSASPSESPAAGSTGASDDGVVGAGEPGGPPPAPLSTAPGSSNEAAQPPGQLAFTGRGPLLPATATTLLLTAAALRRHVRH